MKSWRKAVSAILISTFVWTFPYGAIFADAPQAVVVDTRYPIPLTDALQVKVKSLVSEYTLNGTKIGLVIKLYNVWDSTLRVPDYDLRIVTSTGSSYVLRPSAENAVSVQPMSSVELSYMAQVEHVNNVKPADLIWVDVNKDVFPKVETTILDLPISDLTWYGEQSTITDRAKIKNWGESFAIPSIDSSLTFTTVSQTKDFNGQKPVQVLKLLAQNPGGQTETIPNFIIEGKSEQRIYPGSRADQSVVTLDPGEKKYIYFAVPTDMDTKLTGFNVLTTETFKTPNRTDADAVVTYNIGRLSILPPSPEQSAAKVAALSYEFNTPIAFDPLNTVVDPNMSVSVTDFKMYENKGMGYQTGIVKMKLTNKSDMPVPVPQIAAELMSDDGLTYAGNRQSTAIQVVVPNTTYILNYSFVLPLSDAASAYTLRLNDDKTAPPYKSVIAQFRVPVTKSEAGTNKLAFYPYEVNITDWNLSYLFSFDRYRLKMNWDVKSIDRVIADNNFSKLLLELEAAYGRKIASQTLSLSGENKITSGEQVISFIETQNDQLEFPLTLKIYEVIDTPNGQARQLLSVLNQ